MEAYMLFARENFLNILNTIFIKKLLIEILYRRHRHRSQVKPQLLNGYNSRLAPTNLGQMGATKP